MRLSQVLFTLLLIAAESEAWAGDQLSPLVIQHCSETFCFELKSAKGSKSPFDPSIITFEKAELTVLDKTAAKSQKMKTGSSGYMDSEMGYLVLRQVQGTKSLLLNTQTGKITLM